MIDKKRVSITITLERDVIDIDGNFDLDDEVNLIKCDGLFNYIQDKLPEFRIVESVCYDLHSP